MSSHPSDSTAESLYRNHHHWLKHWLGKKLGCSFQAADLAQDTFVRILGGRQEQLVGLREPRAFLTTIARGLVIDFYRRRTLEQAWLAHLAELPEDEAPSPEQQQILLETLISVDRLLDGLPPKTRAAWLYSRLDGLSHAEIAAHLQVSVPRVRQYLATAARHCYELRFGLAD